MFQGPFRCQELFDSSRPVLDLQTSHVRCHKSLLSVVIIASCLNIVCDTSDQLATLAKVDREDATLILLQLQY
jgi:hypothetical protein